MKVYTFDEYLTAVTNAMTRLTNASKADEGVLLDTDEVNILIYGVNQMALAIKEMSK